MEVVFLFVLFGIMILALISGFPVAFSLPGSAILSILFAAFTGFVFEGDPSAFFAQDGPIEWLTAGVTFRVFTGMLNGIRLSQFPCLFYGNHASTFKNRGRSFGFYGSVIWFNTWRIGHFSCFCRCSSCCNNVVGASYYYGFDFSPSNARHKQVNPLLQEPYVPLEP